MHDIVDEILFIHERASQDHNYKSLVGVRRMNYGTMDAPQISFSVNSEDLKHKDSFGKSETLSKIFFAEILVFDHDYEGKSSSSNGLL